MRFSPAFLDELRARLPVSEVVGRSVMLLVALTLTACKADCGAEYSIATLHRMPLLGGSSDCNSLYCSEQNYKEAMAWVSRLRKYASQQPNLCIRNAYEEWADYYARDFDLGLEASRDRDRAAEIERNMQKD